MDNSARATNYYNSGTAAPTIQSMIDAEAKRAQRVKTLANAHREADRTIKRVQQLKEPNTQQKSKPKQKKAVTAKQTTKTNQVTRTKQATKASEKPAPGVSVFAILGTLFVSVLMVFVVLAQINFNETAAESVRLNILIGELAERQRVLELSFESAVDIREVERFARDELGMSRPDSRHMMVIEAAPRDIALALDNREDRSLEGFGAFLRSLTDYFRR